MVRREQEETGETAEACAGGTGSVERTISRLGQRLFCTTRDEAERMRGELRRGLAQIYDYRLRELVAKGWSELLREQGYKLPDDVTEVQYG